ncbi:MAG TPA: hypothetical protein VEC38_03530 [Candidatus Binataceae bacterium]|nr:hypothetical protein [Candidatus Binataceae bacterium]
MALYFALAVLASTLLTSGLLMMKSRAAALPVAAGARIPSAILAWIRDPMWSGGLLIQTAGYGLYIAALTGAPVSIVSVMMQGGIALFVLFAVVILGERAAPREWAGIGAIVAAMLLLGLSLTAGQAQGALDGRSLLEFSALLAALALLPMSAARLKRNGAAAAIFSGVAFGLGALYTKALSGDFLVRPGCEIALRLATDPYVYYAVIANITGIVMLQNAFHATRGIIAAPLSSALSNLVPIAGGIIAFGERLPAEPLPAAMRILSFALTIAAATLIAGTRDGAISPHPAQAPRTTAAHAAPE